LLFDTFAHKPFSLSFVVVDIIGRFKIFENSSSPFVSIFALSKKVIF